MKLASCMEFIWKPCYYHVIVYKNKGHTGDYMRKGEEMKVMWEELQEFVQQVEKEHTESLEAGPYIEQIREILSKHLTFSS